jgi:hypothetical protein
VRGVCVITTHAHTNNPHNNKNAPFCLLERIHIPRCIQLRVLHSGRETRLRPRECTNILNRAVQWVLVLRQSENVLVGGIGNLTVAPVVGVPFGGSGGVYGEVGNLLLGVCMFVCVCERERESCVCV